MSFIKDGGLSLLLPRQFYCTPAQVKNDQDQMRNREFVP